MSLQIISAKNSEFWNELCGSQLASFLGVTDFSPESLKKYDQWYLHRYPYLHSHIPIFELQQKSVLEIGLGYGTVSQWLAESGAFYTGLDIAEGPVAMVNQRLEQMNLPGFAVQGSVIEAPFPDASFDAIVAIGCLHHTGDLCRAINECRRMLKDGGSLHFMVYNAYSYRRFAEAPLDTLWYRLRELIGFRGVVGNSRKNQRASYDSNKNGDAAPHTDWISQRSLRYMCRDFSSFVARSENITNEYYFKNTSREQLLLTAWPQLFGLDIYAHAVK
ncbi:MAG TPA: class I SAM-dependent methyltransferase [Methylobacter sp.]